MRLNELAKLLKTAGEENRLKILCVIFDKKDTCVSDISRELKISVASCSHHLQTMSKEGLIISKRVGKNIYYQLPKNVFTNDLKKFICKYR
jgi:DNA-binding transcriptional ArsR family regulator